MVVKVVNEQELKEAISNVKDDHSPINWAMASHQGSPELIKLTGSGTGGLNELLSEVKSDNISYAYLRVSEQVEISSTVKFVLLHFVGIHVPLVKKGRFGITRGDIVEKFFSPHHVSICDIVDPSEISEASITRRVAEVSGTAIHEIDSAEGRQMRGFTQRSAATNIKKPESTSKHSVNVSSHALKFSQELRDAMTELRKDGGNVKLVIAEYEKQDPRTDKLNLGKKSAGDIAEFISSFKDEQAQYGLLRTTDNYEGITTVKFVYVAWIGEKVTGLARARVTVHKGACSELFAPHHVTFEATHRSDISEDEVKSKVQSASGSKVNVR